MIFKIGYVVGKLNNIIKLVCISFHIYNKKYKKLIVKNKYLQIYDFRNELINNDYILYKLYKKSKYCVNKIIKIL